MDLHDTTNVLFSKIKSLDPENASKIMGYILIQDLADRDLLRLAFGPETLLQFLVFKAKAYLGLSSSTFSTPLNPISRPNSSNSNNSQNPFPPSSPGFIPRNGFLEFSKKAPSWSPASSPKSSPFLSYENIRSGSLLVPSRTGDSNTDFIDENQMSDYFSFLNDSSSSKNEDFVGHRRSFSASDACFGATEEAGGLLGGYKPCLYFARGFCKNGDNCKFSHELGGLTDNVDVTGAIVGSPSKMDLLYRQHEEVMRVRAAAHQHQQRLAAAQLMAGASSLLRCEKNTNFLLQQQTDAQRAAALMVGEEICKFAQGRAERNSFFAMGLAEKANSASKQIYLTFPADSSFKDEDVSNYFSVPVSLSMFGPVQDVRIPYQQKRMFGFVTFVHPETVKLILSRGNPHFICDSRVLVKPYKEKGKVPEKRQHLQQQFERGNLSPCSSPLGLDSREPYDLHAGAKIPYDAQEMMFRRELEEQVDIRQAIELQRRRFMNLQLPDFKNDGIHHHQRSLSVGASISLPAYSHAGQNVDPSDNIKQEVSEAVNGDNTATVPSIINAAEVEEVKTACVQEAGVGNSQGYPSPKGTFDGKSNAKQRDFAIKSEVEKFFWSQTKILTARCFSRALFNRKSYAKLALIVYCCLLGSSKVDCHLVVFLIYLIDISCICHESSVEHALPDSPFASPKKSTENHLSEHPALMGPKESSASCAASSSDDPLRPIASTSGTTSV
ncbi:Nucleic acid binding protein, putative isoform 2 [Hibiscus syriacus]|uniref:Nucleic acid binding protein, putative isoform 2 n=1 Tax=Hibiscus syriacus TaxID=106335 RepID=A0A6A3CI37_HIBSY|nr:Nucleic acid binding protein, putative isoform 2 [Hibiscus syriacus]